MYEILHVGTDVSVAGRALYTRALSKLSLHFGTTITLMVLVSDSLSLSSIIKYIQGEKYPLGKMSGRIRLTSEEEQDEEKK